jgi:hypothetical protein
MDISFLRFKLQEGARFPAAVFIVGIGIRHVLKMRAWNYTVSCLKQRADHREWRSRMIQIASILIEVPVSNEAPFRDTSRSSTSDGGVRTSKHG